MRTIIISDVHGCIIELKELLNKIKFNSDKDTLVFTGDLMDRGEQSYEVFQFVKELKEKMGTKCHYILGNHEDFICKAQTDRETYSLWVHYNGGIKTITDFENHNDTVFDYIPWLKENTELYYETDDYIVCHGGCRRDVHTDLEDDIVWDRTCIEQGWYGGKLLIVGHTPLTFPLFAGVLNDNYEQHRLKYNEKETYNLKDFPTGCIDIDTGCTFGYWLTAMIIENGEFSLYKVKHHNPAPDADDGIDDDTEVLYE